MRKNEENMTWMDIPYITLTFCLRILSESRGAGEQGFRAARRSWGDAAPEKLHCGPGL